MQSVNNSHTNENRTRNIRSFAKPKEISQDVTDIQVGITERCSKHFIKKCKLHTSSILVCNHPDHVVQIHPAFKTSLALFNFPLKCWEETQRRIITNSHNVPKHDILVQYWDCSRAHRHTNCLSDITWWFISIGEYSSADQGFIN